MKQEATKKSKLWLWLLIGVLVLALAAGGVAALVFGLLGSGEKTTPGGRPELYWNVDRKAYTENSESGLSTREPGEDGIYKVRFAINGELVEMSVADKRLINYIDTMDAMGLVFDGNGTIVDVKDPKELATEVNKNAYVKDVKADKIVANTSIAMNGMNVNVKLDELTQIYDVTPQAEVPGKIIQTSDLKSMDTLCIYANDLEQVTHIYVTSHSKESKVYWRANQMYNSTLKETSREPDENGVYTVPFFCEGERVELKTKDKAIVTKIDGTSRWKCHFGFTFDEEGYIIEQFPSALGISGILATDCWDVVAIDGDTYTIQRLVTNDGSVWTGTIPAECVIYDASYAAMSEGRQGLQVESLQMGDRVSLWTDTTGTPILAYVSNRIVDSPAYWNVSRKYSSKTQETTREVGPSGYYEVKLVSEGKGEQTYYIKDKETMTYLDSISQKCVGLKLGSGNIVEAVYHFEALTGYTCATQGGVVTTVTGGIFTKITYGKPGTEVNLVLAADAKVVNVSAYGTKGALTTIRPGDHVYAYRQPTGEILVAFITKRTIGSQYLYWHLDKMYDSTNKVSTRQPDEEGWYHLLFTHNGKQVTLRTQNVELVNKIDALSIGATALELNGDVITNVYDATYPYGGNKVASGYRFRYVTSEGKYYCVYASDATKTVEFKMADDCVIYNVSSVFDKEKGERITSLKQNDMLTAFCDIYGEAKVVYVRNRDVDNLYWKTDKYYDSSKKVTTRTPDADGYYWYDLAVNGEVKTFKTKDVSVASSMDSYDGAFGLHVVEDEIKGFVSTSYVKNVKGNSVIGYTVKKIEGNKVTVVYNKAGSSYGTEKVIYTNANTKVYDVSPSAEKFGQEIKLQVGDTFRSYLSRDEKTDSYIYVQFHATRSGGEYGYCEVCKKDVQWTPWAGGSVPTADGSHVYLNADCVGYTQTTMDSSSKNYTVCMDLNGRTLTRATPGRAFRVSNGEVLNIMDSVGGGKIVASGGAGYSGGLAMISSGGKINLYSGTLEFVANEDPTKLPHLGGNIYASGEGSTFNMYGGVVTGGTVAAMAKDKGYGGNIYLSYKAEFNQYGGVVSNGLALSQILEETDADGKVTYTNRSGHGGNIFLSNGSYINLYGGEVTGGVAQTEWKTVDNGDGTTTLRTAAAYGGNIYLASLSGQLYAGEVTISNGHAHRGGNVYGTGTNTFEGTTVIGGTANQRGANLMATAGTWTVKGGTKLLDGVAGSIEKVYNGYGGNFAIHGGNITIENATIDGGVAEREGTGGNLYIYRGNSNDTVVTLGKDVVVKNGVAACHGGNIYQSNKEYADANGNPLLSTLIIDGAKIIDGKCDMLNTGNNLGGNIYSAANMTIANAEISGGLQGTSDYDIYVAGYGLPDVEVRDSKIGGKIRVNGPKTFTLSGKVEIGQLNLYKNVRVIVGELKEGTNIAVVAYASSPVFTTPFDSAADYLNAGYFTSFDATKVVQLTADSELSVDAAKIVRYCAHCQKDVEWYEYDANECDGTLVGKGDHFFLPEGGYAQTYGQVSIQGEVTLDLNGQTLTSKEGKRLWRIEGIFNIIDSVGGGKAVADGLENNGGALAMTRKNPTTGDLAVINLYSGALALAEDGKTASNGGVLNLAGGAIMNMYGGEIYGGRTYGNGANINIGDGTLNLFGGSVDGGIYVSASGAVSVSGTAKVANKDKGLELTEGVLLGLGTMEEGAEVYVTASGNFTEVLTDADSYLAYIKSAVAGEEVVNNFGALAIGAGKLDPNQIYAAAKEMTFETTDPDGKVTAKCPACDETVDWYPLAANTSGKGVVIEAGHYYLSASVDYTANTGLYSFSKKNTHSCVHLNGQNVTSTNRVFYTEGGANASLSIMGDGVVTGAGAAITGGYRGACDFTTTVNLYGGTFVSTVEAAAAIDNRPTSHAESYLNIYNGTTITNTAGGYGAIATNKGHLNICGGNVQSAALLGTGTMKVSGAPVIGKLDLTNGAKINVGDLTTGADITVLADGVFTNNLTNAASVKEFFKSGVDGKVVNVEGSALAIGEQKEVICPHCGKTQDEIEWTLWEAPVYTKGAIESGHYYLSGDVNNAKQYYLGTSVDDDTNNLSVDVVIDLRGYDITSDGRVFYYYTNNHLTLFDSVGGGVITGKANASGGVIYAGDGGSGATLGLYNVTVVDGFTGTRTNKGGTIVVSGSNVMNAKNAVITGGSATDGVAIDVSSNATINLENCVVTGGKASGVGGTINVYKGTLNVINSTIDSGEAGTRGPCVYATIGSVNVVNSSVEDIVIYDATGTASVSGKAEIANLDLTSGAKLTVGELTSGSTIAVKADGVFTEDLADAEAVKGYFSSGVADKDVIIEGSALAIGTTTGGGTDPEEPQLSVYDQAVAMDFSAGGTVNAKCPVCGTAQDWVAMSAAATSRVNIADGAHHHYYLDPNTDYTKASNFYYIKSATKVCLNLNGQNMASTARIFYVESENSALNLMGEGTLTSESLYNTTSQNWNGSIIDAVSEVNLYGGTLISTNECPAVAVRGSKSYSVLNIYEGTKIIRTADSAQGANVYISDGSTVNMYGGEIRGGSAVVTPSIHETETYGGNVLIKVHTKTSEFTCNFNMYGGLIADGTAGTKGGNIAVIGNENTKCFANVNIAGGTIENGGVFAKGDNVTLKLSGDPVVDFIDVEGAKLLDVANLKEGASIKIVGATKDVAFTAPIAENAETAATYFYVDELKQGIVANAEKALVLADVCPHCGVAMSEITWIEIANTNEPQTLSESGHYKLTEDICTADGVSGNVITTPEKTSSTGLDIVIDTCGFNATSSNGRAFYINKHNKFTVYDSVGGSEAISNSTNSALGGSCLYVHTGAKADVYDLTMRGAAGANGAGNCISAYGTSSVVNIYSGNFIGTDNTVDGKNGGVVNNSGIMTIYGGTFNGVQLINGVGGCVYSVGTLNICGGEFGGDIYVDSDKVTVTGEPKIAELQIADGKKVTLSELTENADITVNANGEFTVVNPDAQAYVDAGYVKAATGKQITVTDGVMTMSATSLLQTIAEFLGFN